MIQNKRQKILLEEMLQSKLIIVVAISLLFSCSSNSSRNKDEQSDVDVKSVLKAKCFSCHTNYKEMFAPSFNEIFKKRTKSEIEEYIKCIAEKDCGEHEFHILNSEEINALTDYIAKEGWVSPVSK